MGRDRLPAFEVTNAAVQNRARLPRCRFDGRQLFERGTVKPVDNVTSLTAREVVQGGLPPVCLGVVTRSDLWFKGYEQTYLERDVRDLSRLIDLVAFEMYCS